MANMFQDVAHTIAAQPFVYEQIQKILGQSKLIARLEPHVQDAAHKTVLDVGAGTGAYRKILPPETQYLWSDVDVVKLSGFQKRRTMQDRALLGDAVRLGLRDNCADVTLSIALTHHLDDTQIRQFWREMARVTREKMVYVDAVAPAPSLVSRIALTYDRAHDFRSADTILAMIQPHFEIIHVEQFVTLHKIILCVMSPK